jgi:hypothetical protein
MDHSGLLKDKFFNVRIEDTEQRPTSPIKDGLSLMEELLSEMESDQEPMWQSATSIENLYRIYLLDNDGSIEAAAFYAVQDRTAAAEIAAALHVSCSDAFNDYDLWHGTQRITPAQRSADTDAATIQKHQQVVIDLAIRLHDNFAWVSRSRKLVQAIRCL